MSDNAEDGIARTQAAAAQSQGAAGLGRYHGRTVAYLDERILVLLSAIAMIGLLVLWATSDSPWLLYGSLAAVIVLVFLWGYARIARIERERKARARQAEEWQSQASE